MAKRKLRFTIAAMFLATAVVAVVFWVSVPRGFNSLSIERRCKIVISRHLSNTPNRPDELFEYHGPDFDTYEFRCNGDPQSLKRRIEQIEIPDYRVTRNWTIGNCGYSNSQLLTHNKTGATLYLGITWVPIGKYNKITFVWHNNGNDAGQQTDAREAADPA